MNIRRAFIGSAAINLAAMALSLGTTVYASHALDPNEFGIYLYVTTWAVVVSTTAAGGFDRLAIRVIGGMRADGGSPRAAAAFLSGMGGLIALALALLIGIVLLATNDRVPRAAIVIGLASVPFMAVALILSAVVQATGHVAVAQAPEKIARPLLIVALWATVPFVTGVPGVLTFLFSYSAAVVASLALTIVMLLRMVPVGGVRTTPAQRASWLRSSGWLFAAVVVSLISTRFDILYLGWHAPPDQIGAYVVATRIAALGMTVFSVVNIAIGPKVAEQAGLNNHTAVIAITRTWSRTAFALSLPFFLCAFAFPSQALAVFNQSNQASITALIIVLIGQLYNVVTGPAGVVLNGYGRERALFLGLATGAIVNCGLTLILTPRWGVIGSAIANVCGVVAYNTALVAYAARALQVDTTILGIKYRMIVAGGSQQKTKVEI